MDELIGVVFVGERPAADGAGKADGAAAGVGAAVERLIEAGASEVAVLAADPAAVHADLADRSFRAPTRVLAWDPAAGHVPGLLQAGGGARTAMLVAERPDLPPATFDLPHGSNNCILVVREDLAAGRPVDVIDIEYREPRRTSQFPVRGMDGAGRHRHTGLTHLPIGTLDLAAVVGMEQRLAADGLCEELTLLQHRLREQSEDDLRASVTGMDLVDLAERFLAEGRLTAIKA